MIKAVVAVVAEPERSVDDMSHNEKSQELRSAHGEDRRTEEDDARSVLKQRGLRYSRPREAILNFLLEEDRHVSAESLYLDLKKRGEELSLSTVYLNLSALADAGLVRTFQGATGQALYDSNVSPHYHVVCAETGEVQDVPAPKIDGVPLSRFLKEYVERETGWAVDEPRFSLTGRPPRAKGSNTDG